MTALAWAKTVRWWLWALLAAVFAAGVWVAHRLFSAPPEVRTEPTSTRLAAIQERASVVEEQALVARATASATATAHKEELATIMKADDGAERRARLAAFLSGLH